MEVWEKLSQKVVDLSGTKNKQVWEKLLQKVVDLSGTKNKQNWDEMMISFIRNMPSIQAERLKKSVLYFAASILSSVSFLLCCNYVIHIVYSIIAFVVRVEKYRWVGQISNVWQFFVSSFHSIHCSSFISFTYRKPPHIRQWYHTQCTYFVRFAMFCPIPWLNLLFPLLFSRKITQWQTTLWKLPTMGSSSIDV